MTDKVVHTWKAGPEDRAILAALELARVGPNESDRVRAGLRLLMKKNHIRVKEQPVNNE